MEKTLRFNCGIVNGDDMRSLIKILPELESQFDQRKQFDEYYFEEKEVELDINQISRLSEEFTFTIDWNEVRIDN